MFKNRKKKKYNNLKLKQTKTFFVFILTALVCHIYFFFFVFKNVYYLSPIEDLFYCKNSYANPKPCEPSLIANNNLSFKTFLVEYFGRSS